MITIFLFILTILYVGFGVWVCKKLKSWPARITVALLMISPAIYWVGTYQYVKYEHKAVCARDGGLKVLIQPEKADRIQLKADSYLSESTARDLLFQYPPRLAVVEAWDGEYNGNGKRSGYFSYFLDAASTTLPRKNWEVNKVPLAELTTGLYVLSETTKIESDFTKTTWKLERNGQLYATWTKFHHYWTRNPGMPIGWQCFTSTSPDSYEQFPHRVLTELILR
ncbi:MAG: hypothetical protein V4639_11760 [Pseudomonadota bacterium]